MGTVFILSYKRASPGPQGRVQQRIVKTGSVVVSMFDSEVSKGLQPRLSSTPGSGAADA